MTKDFAAGLAVFVLGSVSANAQTPTIDHQPAGCVVADRFPRLEARFASADTVAAARAVFQGANVEQWYSVAMLARSQWLQITGRKRALDDRIRAALLTLDVQPVVS